MRHPKFEQRIKDNIVDKELNNRLTTTYGMVSRVDVVNNTVDLWISGQGNSDLLSEMLFNVPYPVTPGIQGAAPQVGLLAWVDFKGNDYSTPVVTHFYNPNFRDTQERRQNRAVNDIPRFMFNM